MANQFQRQVRARKLSYVVLILALFTASLVHRKSVVESQAEDLQLRETARGEVELTSSAVRLLLTGSSGLANSVLWFSAIKKHDRHEWNELELIVRSITKLQPYFVTPWLFQGWNLAFNVAVECDRPRDKYYYVSRGLNLVAEGERRNQGGGVDANSKLPKFPGNPDMRFALANYCQMKLGQSDEKITMSSLLDVSCIDPVKRDPARVKREFASFCQENPRLVRRLRVGLGYEKPAQIIRFLEESKDIPGRFERPDSNSDRAQSKLKPPREQFPILPPPLDSSSPNPDDADLTQETIDPFLIARTWYLYAQEPLPPPVKGPNEPIIGPNPQRTRLPRRMVLHLFRSYPAVAQENIADMLATEGFFDRDGWLIEDKDWIGKVSAGEREFRVGTEPKYHSRLAWEEAYRKYKEYGTQNGIYLSPSDFRALVAKVVVYLDRLKQDARAGGGARPKDELLEGQRADAQLSWLLKQRATANFDERIARTEAEKSHELLIANKLIFQAESLRRGQDPERAVSLYEQALPLWTQVALAYPVFARTTVVQEDIYEVQLKYFRLLQQQRGDVFRAVITGLLQLNVWPHRNLDQLLSDQDKHRIIPIRKIRGPLEHTLYYAGPDGTELKQFLLSWTNGAALSPMLIHPAQSSWMLTKIVPEIRPGLGVWWQPLVDANSVESVRDRLGLNRTGALAPPKKVGVSSR